MYEAQIHQLEQEAYSSVLRAFKAQADAITWEKESLITDLRKELGLSSEEHRQLLSQVNTDETIKKIREWRQIGGFQDSTVSAFSKKLKSGSLLPTQSFGASFPPYTVSSNAKHVPARKGPLASSAMKVTPFPRAAQNGNMANEGASLIGRRVRTRWPDDNNFYEAVIKNYNPVEKRHALVYDCGTASETWEWISLSEILPEDIQWLVEDPQIFHRDARRTADYIQIRHTDSLIKEVEMVFDSNHSDPVEVEKAKKVVMDQEQALIDAIARLADLSDRKSEGGHHYGQSMERG